MVSSAERKIQRSLHGGLHVCVCARTCVQRDTHGVRKTPKLLRPRLADWGSWGGVAEQSRCPGRSGEANQALKASYKWVKGIEKAQGRAERPSDPSEDGWRGNHAALGEQISSLRGASEKGLFQVQRSSFGGCDCLSRLGLLAELEAGPHSQGKKQSSSRLGD